MTYETGLWKYSIDILWLLYFSYFLFFFHRYFFILFSLHLSRSVVLLLSLLLYVYFFCFDFDFDWKIFLFDSNVRIWKRRRSIVLFTFFYGDSCLELKFRRERIVHWMRETDTGKKFTWSDNHFNVSNLESGNAAEFCSRYTEFIFTLLYIEEISQPITTKAQPSFFVLRNKV